MSEDAKNSIFAWASVLVFLGAAALTVKLVDERHWGTWSPITSGVIAFAGLYYTVRHFIRQRRDNSRGERR